MEHFFSPNSSADLRLDAHQSQIIGGDADEDKTIVGGGYSQIIGGIYPPIPPGFRHPCQQAIKVENTVSDLTVPGIEPMFLNKKC